MGCGIETIFDLMDTGDDNEMQKVNDKILLKEIFRRLGHNFYENGQDPEIPKTDSEIAADALLETLYNMGFDEGVHYSREDYVNDDGCWECKFEILM